MVFEQNSKMRTSTHRSPSSSKAVNEAFEFRSTDGRKCAVLRAVSFLELEAVYSKFQIEKIIKLFHCHTQCRSSLWVCLSAGVMHTALRNALFRCSAKYTVHYTPSAYFTILSPNFIYVNLNILSIPLHAALRNALKQISFRHTF